MPAVLMWLLLVSFLVWWGSVVRDALWGCCVARRGDEVAWPRKPPEIGGRPAMQQWKVRRTFLRAGHIFAFRACLCMKAVAGNGKGHLW
jgi:hypothetical protein